METKPDVVIIHCGTNDVKSHKTADITDMLDSLCKTILNIDASISIGISCLTPRKHFHTDLRVSFINSEIRKLCDMNSYTCINHPNMYTSFLCRDGLHLNKLGISVLAQSFSYFLEEHYFQFATSRRCLRTQSPEWKAWLRIVSTVSQNC